MTILQKIKKLCKGRKTNISNLEKALGLSNGVIGRWDKSSPHVDSLKKVADYFGVTVDELLPDDEPEPKPGHNGIIWDPTEPVVLTPEEKRYIKHDENVLKRTAAQRESNRKYREMMEKTGGRCWKGGPCYAEFEKLCKEKGITAYRVAKETGVSTSTLTSWKQGKYLPKIEKIRLIAKCLGVPEAMIYEGGRDVPTLYYRRVCELCKEDEITIPDVEEALEFLPGTINEGMIPTFEEKLATASFFGVPFNKFTALETTVEDPHDTSLTVGERIRKKRKEAGYSEDDLAALMGYASGSTIKKMERDELGLTGTQQQMLAAILHTTPAYIMGWNEPEPMADDNTIYGRMRRLAEKKGIDLQKMEEELQLGSGVMTRWKHRAEPNTKVLRKIADYLGVSLDYLIAGKEQKSSDEKLEKLLGELAGIISQIKEVL